MTEDAALYLGYAEVALRKGDLVKAADSFQVALQFEARSVVAMIGLGHCHILGGNLDDGRTIVMRALAIEPENHRARKLLGEIHAKSGRFDLAIVEFKKAAEFAADARRPRVHGR